MLDNMEFKKSDVYSKDIFELVHELKVLCKQENIPFFFAACVENNDHASKYELEMLSAALCDTKLTDDWISKFVAITRGFNAVPGEKPVEIDAAFLASTAQDGN